MIGTVEEEPGNGNSGFYFDMAKEILEYCYTDSEAVMNELKYFAGQPKKI